MEGSLCATLLICVHGQSYVNTCISIGTIPFSFMLSGQMIHPVCNIMEIKYWQSLIAGILAH